MIYNEPLRPQTHFSPKENWMNDPNGCVFYRGKYHLFFQYHPFSTEWGPMHWGHAISYDLIHWEQKNIALYPNDKLGMAFSGSVVIDKNNATGFFPDGDGLLAFFTNHLEMDDRTPALQQQSLAWSADEGMTWNEYKENPIIHNPGLKDFRDPKVFFHTLSGKWVMILSGGTKVLIYVSINLLNWVISDQISFEGEPGIVECPDLISFQSKDGKNLWLLIVSFLQTESYSKPTVRHFPGHFDGNEFIFHSGMSKGLVTDHGRDFYAPQSWYGIPAEDGRNIWIGWCNHWAYSNQTPTESWRGVMSLPRELYLDQTDSGLILKQLPVSEFKQLRKKKEIHKNIDKSGETIILNSESSHEFLMNIEDPFNCSFEISFNYKAGDSWKLKWDHIDSLLTFDRSGLNKSDFNKFFLEPTEVQIKEKANLELRIILDRSIVEIFGMKGKYVMTNQIFPSDLLESLTIKTECGHTIKEFIHHTLDSIWKLTDRI